MKKVYPGISMHVLHAVGPGATPVGASPVKGDDDEGFNPEGPTETRKKSSIWE